MAFKSKAQKRFFEKNPEKLGEERFQEWSKTTQDAKLPERATKKEKRKFVRVLKPMKIQSH